MLATARGVTLKAPGYIKRDNSTEDHGIVETLFRLPRTKAGDATAQPIRLANGNVAVVVLSGVKDAEAVATTDAAQQQRQRDALAGAEFGAYRKAIEKSIAIKIVNPPAADVAPTPES